MRTKAIWFTTGNPFVDMGQEMMAVMAQVDSVEELDLGAVEPLVPRLINLFFQEGWLKSSYTIFPNSELNNGNNRKERYTALLGSWLELVKNPTTNLGTSCAISGKPAQVFLARSHLPMADSVGGNFNSANQAGVPVSAAVALAVQFSALATVRSGGLLILPHFSDYSLQSRWARMLLPMQALKMHGTVSKRIPNAIFEILEWFLCEIDAGGSATIYTFSNENRSPSSSIYFLSGGAIRFVSFAQSKKMIADYKKLIRRGFYRANDETPDELLINQQNQIYENLINNKSISGFFLDRNRRKTITSWGLYRSYLRELR